jgi:hypothetical protein
MKYILTYDTHTLAILQTANGGSLENEEIYAATLPNAKALCIDHPYIDCELHYMEGGQVKNKMPFPELKITNGKIQNIPDNTRVEWPDYVVTEESSELEFDSNVSGEFVFIFDAPRYLTHTRIINYNVET